jgi:hypothetical protein
MKSQKLEQHQAKNVMSEWFTGCESEEEKEELRQYLLNASRLTDQLKQLIQKRYDREWGSKVADYDCPSWAHRQAHKNGRLDAYEEIYKLLP